MGRPSRSHSAAAHSFLTAALMALLHVGVVRREERYLDHTFGEPYRTDRGQIRGGFA